MQDTLFIVMGSCGVYDDAETWMVCAYATERQAEAHKVKAQAAYDAALASNPGDLDTNPYDSRMRHDSMTRTTYYIDTCPVRTRVPR